MKKLLGVVLGCLAIVGSSQATIISGAMTTDLGKVINLSGVEWLSFDDSELGTFNVSRAEIEAEGSKWMQAGWRYANEDEIAALFRSLWVYSGADSNYNDGVKFLLDNWGSSDWVERGGSLVVDRTSLSMPEYIYYENYRLSFGLYGYEMIPEGFSKGVWINEENDVIFERVNPTDPDYIQHRDAGVLWQGSYIDRVEPWLGSYLVRGDSIYSKNSVPEPSSILLMLAAGLGMVGVRYNTKRPH